MTLDLENAPYGGYRFPINVQMAGRRFIGFHVDMAIGDYWIKPHEKIPINDWFGFANIPTVSIPAISMEQHFAEKLHAYTQSREHQNSRVKDLLDMILLINENKMSKDKIKEVTKETFKRRENSFFPPNFPTPPDNWKSKYALLAKSCNIDDNIDNAWILVKSYGESIEIIQVQK